MSLPPPPNWVYTLADNASTLIFILAIVGVLEWIYLSSKHNWYKQALRRSLFATLILVSSLSVLDVLADWYLRERLDNVEITSKHKTKKIELALTYNENRYSASSLLQLARQHPDTESAVRGFEMLADITHRETLTSSDVKDVICFLQSLSDKPELVTDRQALSVIENTLLASANALYGSVDTPEISPQLKPSLDALIKECNKDVVMVFNIEPDEDTVVVE